VMRVPWIDSGMARASPIRGRMGAMITTWLLDENIISQSANSIQNVCVFCESTTTCLDSILRDSGLYSNCHLLSGVECYAFLSRLFTPE